tara:strand:+ start:7491 stop:8252 length:762 start_codon:yes stop_codon:yes gene_type:complete
MIDYKIAIPSFKRHKIIEEYCFKHLNEAKIDFSKIYLFLCCPEDMEQYEKFEKQYSLKLVFAETKNINEKRNFIRDYFEQDDYIVNRNDSFNGINRLVNGKTLEKFTRIDDLCKDAYGQMIRNETKLFAINMVSNPFFMKNKISTKNGTMSAKFYGYINDKDEFLKPCVPSAGTGVEDIEIAIRHYIKFGKIVRYMNLTFANVKYFKIAGGIQARLTREERKEQNTKGNIELCKMFPKFVSLKKNGFGLRLKQ